MLEMNTKSYNNISQKNKINSLSYMNTISREQFKNVENVENVQNVHNGKLISDSQAIPLNHDQLKNSKILEKEGRNSENGNEIKNEIKIDALNNQILDETLVLNPKLILEQLPPKIFRSNSNSMVDPVNKSCKSESDKKNQEFLNCLSSKIFHSHKKQNLSVLLQTINNQIQKMGILLKMIEENFDSESDLEDPFYPIKLEEIGNVPEQNSSLQIDNNIYKNLSEKDVNTPNKEKELNKEYKDNKMQKENQENKEYIENKNPNIHQLNLINNHPLDNQKMGHKIRVPTYQVNNPIEDIITNSIDYSQCPSCFRNCILLE